MNVPALFRLMATNPGRIDWRRWHRLPMMTACSIFHSVHRFEQWLLMGWRVKAELDHPPLFVLGHWRTGTTLLHELLGLDPRHTYPTTYECFAPNHFLISETTATKLLAFLLPEHRPMDNMAVGWQRPQEDEFALCNLGLPSPYLTLAFPNEPPRDQAFLTLEHVPAKALEHWKHTFRRFLHEINFRARILQRSRGSNVRQRIVLKSPPHTGRIKILLDMFPDAKFVHIVRDPYAVFPSTMHLWKTLYATEGLQKPTFSGLEEYVFHNLTEMYRRFERDRELIPAGNLCELHYETLVADPLAAMRRVYDELELGEFDAVRPALQAFCSAAKDYETNQFPKLSAELRQQIAERWRAYAEKYGYPPASEPATPS